jgi:hypothetical protein
MAKQPKAMKKYFKEVKKHLLCSWSEKNGFVSFIQDQLDHEILNDQNITREKLVEILGEPDALARSFDSVNQSDIRLRAKFCSLKSLVNVCFIVFAVLLVAIMIYEFYHLGGTIKLK